MKIKFAITLFLLLSGILYGQEQNQVITLFPAGAPGSEDWNWKEEITQVGTINPRLVYNVTNPTLTVFKAPGNLATGTALIVCPGGAFQFLSIDNEGYDVAKWLNTKGITAFVLKYRLSHSLTNNPVLEMITKQPNSAKFNEDIKPVVAMDIADGKAAIIWVRQHASEYGISAEKIGIMGFSAGGTVTTGVAFTYDKESRPDFAVPVYPYVGSFEKPAVPADAPPLFIVVASDDMFGFQDHCIKLYTEWTNAKKSAELHIYAKGNHGFGMTKKNLPVDTWIERFYDWLKMQGF